MSDQTIHSQTDENILKLLETSMAFSLSQKKQIKGMFNLLNEEQKKSLWDLLSKEKTKMTQLEKNMHEEKIALQQLTLKKIKEKNRKVSKQIRTNVENLSKQKEEKNMDELFSTLEENNGN